MNTPDPYLSPFAWRYGSAEMRALWSEGATRRLWRSIWVALARVQCRYGLVTPEQVADLESRAADVDLPRALEIEAEIHHDVMAEVRAFAEQCPVGGGVIHLGATAMDVRDNATALQARAALDRVIAQFEALLRAFAASIETWADRVCMGFTHLQPAEPTTVGYRLAGYAQDLLLDYADLLRAREMWRGKGFKGAVGTSASYALLLEGRVDPAVFEAEVMAELDLPAWPVANQVYPRRQDWAVLTVLSGIGSTLYRFAMDLRVLQTPAIGEWAEPFGAKQVGSSAMPFKRNPIRAEKIDSLARYLAQLPRVAWDNAALSLLERTLATYGPFAGIERLLMRLAQAGASRQAMHEVLREVAMRAWAHVEAGELNPLLELLTADTRLLAYLSSEQIAAALQVDGYVGDAPQRARALAADIRRAIS